MIQAYEDKNAKRTNLTDDQRAVFNSQTSAFRINPVVRDFENMIGQTANMVASMNQDSGPGDIAAVYQFMKTLDPSSVVRETEFAMAAKSAGVLPYISNAFQRLEKGEVLTPEQRVNFQKLMQKYLENKGAQYDRLYDDMKRVTDNEGIPESILPKRATDILKTT